MIPAAYKVLSRNGVSALESLNTMENRGQPSLVLSSAAMDCGLQAVVSDEGKSCICSGLGLQHQPGSARLDNDSSCADKGVKSAT